jgi:3-oxoacyl-[acyl-carrier-protein] synthase-3
MKWFTNMAAQIEMVSVARPLTFFYPGNSIGLSTRAARACLNDAGIDPYDLGLLINTGIYRYKNTGEPAIAAIIQNKIIPNEVVTNNSGNYFRHTFSFDLNNGGCGFLTGIEIISGSINNGEINYGMVVTGDSDPFYGLSEGFTFNTAAAAIILSKSDNTKGFSHFRTYSFPEYSEEFISRTFFKRRGRSRKGRNILKIAQKESYPDQCVDCAAKSMLNFLEESGKKLNEIDLIIPSQSPFGFTDKLKKRLGLNGNLVEMKKTGNKVLHSAGQAFALKKAWDDSRFKNSRNTIFLSIGSGITISVALYTN